MEGNILPHAFVPLHKHRDPEIFHVLEGEIDFYVEVSGIAQWRSASPGDVIVIPSDAKHAFRNTKDKCVRTMVASGREIYEFFREVVEPFDPSSSPAPPTKEHIQVLVEAAAKYRYWMASPEENAAIGLFIPPAV